MKTPLNEQLDGLGKWITWISYAIGALIVCRCETISEGEIIDAIRRSPKPVSLDGIKRRCNAGMGRCQSGFCGPRVQEILANELGVSQLDIMLDKNGSYILCGRTKENDNE